MKKIFKNHPRKFNPSEWTVKITQDVVCLYNPDISQELIDSLMYSIDEDIIRFVDSPYGRYCLDLPQDSDTIHQ